MNTTTTARPAVPAAPSPRRVRWLRTLGWLLFAWLVVSVFTVVALLGELLPAPVEITINGTSVASGLDLAALPAAHKLALAVVAAVATMVALLLAFAAVAVVAVALVPILLLIVGLPVLVGGVVLLALLSPFVLLAWMLWRTTRSPGPAAATP